MSRYYNKESKRITCREWLKLIEDENYRLILETELTYNYRLYYTVTTQWLGISYPAIFETSVQGEGVANGEFNKYETEEAAKDGHVATLRSITEDFKSLVVIHTHLGMPIKARDGEM